MILAAASINYPDYVPTDYQTFLLTTLIMLIHGVISSMPTRWIANFNSVGSTFNIIALIIVIIVIPAATNREEQGLPKFAAASDVWGTIYEGTDWPAGIGILMSFVAVNWCVFRIPLSLFPRSQRKPWGVLPSSRVTPSSTASSLSSHSPPFPLLTTTQTQRTMSGYDAPFHLSEECSNANIASPRAIVLTSGIGGLFGWFLQLVVAYTVIDIDGVIDSDLGQPWAAYLLQVLPTNAALACLALTVVCAFSMGQGCMIAASRVTFAYARDGCFPCSWWIARVNEKVRFFSVFLTSSSPSLVFCYTFYLYCCWKLH